MSYRTKRVIRRSIVRAVALYAALIGGGLVRAVPDPVGAVGLVEDAVGDRRAEAVAVASAVVQLRRGVLA